MPNWAITCYAIEGEPEVLKKIENAVLNHPVEDGSSDDWEGNVLVALGIEWDRYDFNKNERRRYMRGFIQQEPWYNNGVLFLDAQEAWGVTDFGVVLEDNLPVKVYYTSEEPMMDVFETNDFSGKYFRDRFYVDLCIKGDYQSEYFTNEESMWNYISEITGGEVKCMDDVEGFNEKHGSYEEEVADDDRVKEQYFEPSFVNIHKYKIV